MANFLINLLIVSVVTGILALVLKLTAHFFKNKYTCFIKQLIWIVLAIRLIVPLSYNNTFFTLNSKLYEDEDIVTYSMTNMVKEQEDTQVYISSYNKDSLPVRYSGENEISGYDTTDKILNQTMLHGNEEILEESNIKHKEIYQIRYYVNQIMYVYLAGIVVFLLYHLVAYILLLMKIKTKSEIIESGQVFDILNETANEKGLHRVPKVAFMENINSPMAVGFFRFKILLPRAEYTDRELNAVFQHEITHILHNDLRIKWIYLLANAIHWFNPLIYMMVREASLDMEFYCDYSVVEDSDEDERMEYNELLISILKNHSRSDRQSLLTTYFKGGVKEMKSRFLANLDMRKKKQGIMPTFILICVIVLSAGLFSINTIEADAGNEESFWNTHELSQRIYDVIYAESYEDIGDYYNDNLCMDADDEEASQYYLKSGDSHLPMQPRINENGDWEIPSMYSDEKGYVYVDYYEFKKDGVILDYYLRELYDNKREKLSEVPQLTIYCGTQRINNYGVRLNHWDTSSQEFVPTDDKNISDEDNFFVKQAPLTNENPLVTVSTWNECSDSIYLYFEEGKQPDLINIQDTVLTDDGHIRYPGTGFETIYRTCSIDTAVWFPVCEHYSIGEYEEWITYEDINHPFNRGYRINCYWNTVDGMQSCTYYMVIRTQSEKYMGVGENEE